MLTNLVNHEARVTRLLKKQQSQFTLESAKKQQGQRVLNFYNIPL